MDNKLITLEEENFYKELFEKIEKHLEKHLEKHSEWSRIVARMGSVDDDFILRSKENLEENKINIRELLGELRSVGDDYRLIFEIENKFKCQICYYKEFDDIYFYTIYFNLDVLKLAIKKDCGKKVLSKIEWQSSGKTTIFEKQYCMGDKNFNKGLEMEIYKRFQGVEKEKMEKRIYFIFMVAICIIVFMIVFLIGVA